jgi:hypothetical protein
MTASRPKQQGILVRRNTSVSLATNGSQALLERNDGFDDTNTGVEMAYGFTYDRTQHPMMVGAFHGVAGFGGSYK